MRTPLKTRFPIARYPYVEGDAIAFYGTGPCMASYRRHSKECGISLRPFTAFRSRLRRPDPCSSSRVQDGAVLRYTGQDHGHSRHACDEPLRPFGHQVEMQFADKLRDPTGVEAPHHLGLIAL